MAKSITVGKLKEILSNFQDDDIVMLRNQDEYCTSCGIDGSCDIHSIKQTTSGVVDIYPQYQSIIMDVGNYGLYDCAFDEYQQLLNRISYAISNSSNLNKEQFIEYLKSKTYVEVKDVFKCIPS